GIKVDSVRSSRTHMGKSISPDLNHAMKDQGTIANAPDIPQLGLRLPSTKQTSSLAVTAGYHTRCQVHQHLGVH
ncbi:hypothetical protein SARC_15346, partial [Sphaeroforma arctica JP610]